MTRLLNTHFFTLQTLTKLPDFYIRKVTDLAMTIKNSILLQTLI